MEKGKFFEVKKGCVIGVVIMAFLTLAIVLSFDRIEATWRTVFSRFESVNVAIFIQGETRIPENLPASEAPRLYVVIEGVADEFGNMPPTPVETRILYEAMEEIDDALDIFVFTQPGVFRYRVSIETADELISADGLTLWEIDDHLRYYTFTVAAENGVLEVSTHLDMYDGDNDYEMSVYFDDVEELVEDDVEDEDDRDVVFVFVTKRYVSVLPGTWEHGTGNWMSSFEGRREIHIFADEDSFSNWRFDRRDWRLTSDRQIEIANRNDDNWEVFDMKLIDDRLYITDEEGNQRSWWREGTREDADEVFMGTWHFSHGTRFQGRYREMNFKGNYQLIFTGRTPDTSWESYNYWELNSDNEILVGSFGNRRIIWELDETGSILTMTTGDGDVSTWTRDETDVDVIVDDSWLITEYSEYFDLEDGYSIVHNERMAGESFEFIIYEIEPEGSVWAFDHVVVVKKEGEVFDVIEVGRDQYWRENTIYEIVEMDFTFNGEMDILINHGYVHSLCWGDMYSGYIVQDGQLVEVFSRMCGIRVNPNLEMFALYFIPSGGYRLFGLVDGRLVEVASLTDRSLGHVEDHGFYRELVERLLVNGEWVESRLCRFGTEENWDWHHCDETYDSLLYERIHGENGLWNFASEDWIYIGDLIIDE